MKRSNLIIYDQTGKVWFESGVAEGDVLDHTYPEGLPYLEVPFDDMKGKRLKAIDVSGDSPKAILESLPLSREEELENQLLMSVDGLL